MSSDGGLYGGNGNDLIIGNGGFNDTLAGGAGNDTIQPGMSDHYIHGDEGDDHYLINRLGRSHHRFSHDAGFDSLDFGAGITPSDVSMIRMGDFLMLVVNTPNDAMQIDVPDFFARLTGNLEAFEQITFVDGTVWDLPAAWLKSTLEKLPTCPNSRIDELLPIKH